MTITLQLRSGDVVYEDQNFQGKLPEIVKRGEQYFVRAGVAEQRALYLDGTLLELENV